MIWDPRNQGLVQDRAGSGGSVRPFTIPGLFADTNVSAPGTLQQPRPGSGPSPYPMGIFDSPFAPQAPSPPHPGGYVQPGGSSMFGDFGTRRPNIGEGHTPSAPSPTPWGGHGSSPQFGGIPTDWASQPPPQAPPLLGFAPTNTPPRPPTGAAPPPPWWRDGSYDQGQDRTGIVQPQTPPVIPERATAYVNTQRSTPTYRTSGT